MENKSTWLIAAQLGSRLAGLTLVLLLGGAGILDPERVVEACRVLVQGAPALAW